MKKYIFTPDEQTMIDNGKDAVKLENFRTVVMTTYGTVEEYNEPQTQVNENYEDNYTQLADTNNDVFLIGKDDYNSLKEYQARAVTLEQEFEFYAPVINIVKMYVADKDITIEKLTADLVAKSDTDEKYAKLKATLASILGD